MLDSSISSRMKKILIRICQEPGYVTISTIAKDLGVSTKTVLRELDDIEGWLESRGCRLSKKTGTGIKVLGSEEEKEAIRYLFHGEIEENACTPQERQLILISELLQNQEPVKLYSFAALLKVTEGTVSHDLDKVEPWLSEYGIEMIRKPGLGVFINGSEQSIRKAMVQFIYENVDENQLLRLVRSNLLYSGSSTADLEIKTKKRLLNLIDQEIIRKLEVSIRDAENKMGYKLADSAYVGLIVHLALAIQRIRKNKEIHIDQAVLHELKLYPEFRVATSMAVSLAENFCIVIPEDEIGYITMHLKGSKNREQYIRSDGGAIGSYQLMKLAKQIIKIAGAATGYDLEEDENLLIGLVNHLGPSINRLKLNMDIRNPFIESIKSTYPDLWEISRTCVQTVEEQIGIPMPEAEIAYIAMHLGAAIENRKRAPKRVYRCAIACPTGIGTSRLLGTRIEKEYDNLEIVDVISTLYIEEERLREQHIELIISTVPIENCLLPVVTVNPLLFEDDKKKINTQLGLLKGNAIIYAKAQGIPLQLKDKMLLLNQYNKAIMEVLDHFFLVEDTTSEDINAIIERVSSVLESDTNKRSQLASALRQREMQGGTLITGHQFILLHCRTNAIKHVCFGAVKIGRRVMVTNGNGEQELVRVGIVMLAPAEAQEAQIETISHISRMLIERPKLAKMLQEESHERVWKELCSILEEFYKFQNNKLMGA